MQQDRGREAREKQMEIPRKLKKLEKLTQRRELSARNQINSSDS